MFRHYDEPRVKLLLAERRIIPYSTNIHWRNQNYSNEFGCQAGEAHRSLLEYRWVQRFVWFLDRFHSVYSFGRETSRRIFVVWWETDKTASDIICDLNCGVNWQEIQSSGRSRNGLLKNQSSIMLEDYEESISLTLRTRSSKKPSGMFKKWKHQWLPLCLARHARRVSMGRPVANQMISSQNLSVSWKPVNPQECGWKNLNPNIMRTILQEKGTIHCNITIWYTNLFLCLKPWRFQQQKQQWIKNGRNWQRFRRGTWQKSETNLTWLMKQGRKGAKVHFASLLDICYLKNAELETKHQKYKGRVVPQGDIVKDDSGSYSCKVHLRHNWQPDIISRLPGCAGQASNAVSAYTQVKMEDVSTLLKIPKSECPRYLDSSTTTQVAKIMV